MYNWLMLFLAFLLVGLNAMFVAAEFAWVKVMRVRIEMLADSGNGRAKLALFGINNLDAYLSVCQLGITLASLGLGWIGEPAVAGLLSPLFRLVGIENPTLIQSISIIAGFSFITFLHVIFGELMPKTLSIQRAESVVLALAPLMRFFYFIFLPMVKVLNGTSNLFLRIIGLHQASGGEHSHTPEELQMLIIDSEKSGYIDEQESRMLDNVIRLDKRDAYDVMVHRMDAVTLSTNNSVADVIAEVKRTGHTRFPVFKEDRDNIVGFINIKDLLGADPEHSIKAYVRKPFYVIDTMPLDDMLLEMQKVRQQMGIVIDEYGDWQGIITMEDILEIIVGDLNDEHDQRDAWHIQEKDGVIRVQAATPVEELYEYFGLPPEDQDDYTTVAGLFLDKFGMVPELGDSVVFNDRRLIVSQIDGKRIKEIE
ncbi:MAG: HlyC/CorC family transporter, partial [Desulfovibrionaceae bacterium]|nr:HlyC/CorC family transporter [Desulfovibrionaceae bacterium]